MEDSARAPLRIQYLDPVDELTVARQVPPAGARSFSATYVGPAGWGFDPPGAEGAARLVNQLVTSGAGPYDRVELARRLDQLGATLSHDCAPESAELTVWGPQDAWPELLRILALVVQRPRFAPEDLRRARRQLIEHQLRESSQPAYRAERELLQRIFPPSHPYRGTGLGTRRTVGRVTRERLVRFHRERYVRRDGLVVVTARAPAPEIQRVVRRLFSTVPRGSAGELHVAAGPSRAVEERELDLPGRSQVEVRLGGPSLARCDPEYPAAYLANEILGGRPLLSRLFQQVRERAGLAYYASSDLEAMRLGGYWEVQAGTGADRWRRVVPLLARELARLRERSPSVAEVDVIRESSIGEVPLALESTAEAHELAVDAAYHRLPEDHWLRWPETLRAVRPNAIRDAARAYLGERGMVTVVAGPLRTR